MAAPVVFLNGFYVGLEEARVSVLDRGFCYGDGLFETMRSYGGTIFRLGLHFDRLWRSAGLLNLPLPLTRMELASIVETTLKFNSCPEAYVRITLTRGESAPGLLVDDNASPTLVVFVKPFDPVPDEWRRDGVAVALFPSSACRTGGLAAQVKSCNYLSQIVLRNEARKRGSAEALLLDDGGHVTEGTTSNIFLVADGVLKTPPANQYVLPGITRQVVMEIARAMDLPCFEENLTLDDLRRADEVFLTNTGIEVLPVSRIDGVAVGDGKPGYWTRLLHREFVKNVEDRG
ncbi:MAG: aminotransferase class IV [Nitrospinae bacterium]|nr:aminotransferase class IV [Nitrospinota bacterium]